jgi:AsmA protein
MSQSLKRSLFVVGGLLGLVVLVAVTSRVLVDVDAYKSRLEAAASDALGMTVRIGGRLGIEFFPGVRVTLEDVHIRSRGSDVFSAEEARIKIALLPLLHKEVRIRTIALKGPMISIERDQDGRFNFEKTEKPPGALQALDLTNVSVVDGTLRYANRQSGRGFDAGGCLLHAHRLRLSGGESTGLGKHLSVAADFSCREIRTRDFTASDLAVSVQGEGGVLHLKSVTMRIFGGHGSGSARVDLSAAIPHVHVDYALSRFRIEELLTALLPKKVAEGSMDLSVSLSIQGKTAHELKQTAEGEASLRGDNLVLEGRDLDREIARVASSQNFNLVDVGAVFFAGPLGLAVTKGYNFANLFAGKGRGGRSRIGTFVSGWKVERGVAQAKDVALATNKNRIALKGGLDFVNDEFADVIVAVIDARGCATMRQRIRGPFQKPVVEKPNVLKSVAGPALKLLKQTREVLRGGSCDVFYAGSVAPLE